eukprot:4507242-Pyramimonas_sp.AAC.1
MQAVTSAAAPPRRVGTARTRTTQAQPQRNRLCDNTHRWDDTWANCLRARSQHQVQARQKKLRRK